MRLLLRLPDPSNQLLSLTQQMPFAKRLSVPVTGLGPNQIGQISVRANDPAPNGAPYGYCTSNVTFETPAQICKKGAK
ncbi:MAG: hypothetical protein ACOH2M_06785 [Cypionkella sp.]